jgi:hypothetical protein
MAEISWTTASGSGSPDAAITRVRNVGGGGSGFSTTL